MATTDFVVKNGLVVNENALIRETTNSTSTTTGALVVDGGVGIANSLVVGGASTFNNNLVVTGDLEVQGGDITTNQTTFNLVNATATTLNIGGSATVIEIGATTGTTNINNNLDVDGDVNIDGGDITVSTATFNLANTTATTMNFAGAATALTIGATTGTATIRNANTVLSGDLEVQGGDITTNQTTFNLVNTNATTLNIGSAATTARLGATTGTLTLGNPTVVGTSATQALYNTVATTLNIGGAATAVSIGAATGTTNIANNLNVVGDLDIDGGDLTASTASFNLINTTASTLNIGGAATALTLGAATGTATINNANTVLIGDLEVRGGDLTTNQTTFNLVNATATTLNVGSAASTARLGATTGTLTLGNPTVVGTSATQALYNTVATTVNAFGAATSITLGANTGTTTINSPQLRIGGVDAGPNFIAFRGISGDGAGSYNHTYIGERIHTPVEASELLIFKGNDPAAAGPDRVRIFAGEFRVDTYTSAITGADFETIGASVSAVNRMLVASDGQVTLGANIASTNTTTGTLVVTGGVGISGSISVGGDYLLSGDLAANGGDITTNQTTFNLVNATATTLNIGGAATTLNIGAATGTLTLNNPTAVGTSATQNLYNTVATTMNFAGAATSLTIGATTGTATIRNANTVVTGDLAVNGGDLTTTATTFNLLNATATTVNAFGAATTLELGAATGTTNINNNLDVDGDVNIDGGDLTVSTSTFNLATSTATTVNAFTAATTLELGAATGTTNINNDLDVDGDVNIDGGDITTSSATSNVLNTVATTVNAFGAASTLNVGATTGTLTLRNPTVVGSQTTQTLYDTVATTVNFAGAATTLNIGNATTSTVTLRPGTLVGSNTTQSVYNTVATTVNAFGASTALTLGATTGTATIRNANTVLSGDLAVQGGDITTNQASFNLVNATATTLNIGGAATTVSIGAGTGTTTVNNSLVVTGNLTVNGTTTTVNSTTVSVDDINITLGDTAAPTDATANGGGITLRGATDKTILWVDATDRWTFNQNIEATGIQNTPIGDSVRGSGAFTTLTSNSTTTFTQGTESAGTGSGTVVVTGGIGLSGNINSGGNGVFAGDVTVSGGDIFSAAATASTLYSTTTTGNISLATGLTSGTLTVGGTSATGTITLDPSTVAHTLNVGTGANGSGITKTINLGTGGAAGSTTNISIGSASGGALTLSSPTVNFPNTTGTAPFTVASTTVVTNLNADLLDGLSEGSFLRSNATDAYTSGTLTFNSGTTLTAAAGATVNFSNTTGTAPFTVASTTVVTNLNADLLDGLSEGSFLRSDVADTWSASNGPLIVTTPAGSLGSNTGQVNTLQVFQATAGTDAYMTFHISGDHAAHFGLDGTTNDLFYGGWSVGAVKNKVWHAGNDGSGSGLDADLLDGLNQTSANTASTIVARDASGNFSAGTITAALSGNATTASSTPNPTFSADAVAKDDITTRTETGFYESSTGTLAEGWPTNSGSWHHLIAATHSNDVNYYSLQLSSTFFDQNFYIRATNGSGTTAWSKVWTSSDATITAGNLTATSGTGSTSTTSGALVVTGGVGISQNVYIGGTLNAANLAYTGTTTSSVSTISAAGSTQGTATVVTTDLVVVSTVAAGTGIVLPVASTGKRIIVRNNGATDLRIYPASGAQINALGTNNPFILGTATTLEYIGFNTTQWYTVSATFA